ncbi:MAG TPA: hypothetical protein ENL05_01590 [Candidatus Moranbacteria bacterium]|nr:hypothetical protein [Candidatus Moranbacteria bacterium]
MTLKAYIWGMRSITLLSLIALGVMIVYVDPESSGIIGITLFYLIVFFVLSGIFNLGLIFIRRKLLGNEIAASNVGLSFRQGILLAVLCLVLLILQSFRILVWWDALLALGGILLIELYFLNKD